MLQKIKIEDNNYISCILNNTITIKDINFW